jgi:Uma2 family endonuclease
MEVLEKMMTYAEYRQMEFEEDDQDQYELLNGILMKKGSPTIQHQRISGNIYFKMRLFIEEKALGEVFAAPLDVVLDDHNAPQPDVFFVSKKRSYILNETEQAVIGIPDLVVEILSPGSIKKDRVEKKAIYERFSVPEFWLVDPIYRNIEVLRLAEGRYETFDFVEETGTVKSSVLEGFELDLVGVF